MTLLADHLWQSTIVALLAALVALALRRHRASLRYGIWLAASLKFLVPFALLAAIGGAFSWRTVEVIPYEESPALIETVSQPFTQTEVSVRTTPAPLVASRSLLPGLRAVLLPVWALGTAGFLLLWGVRWQRVRRTLRRATPLTSGREVDILGRLSAGLGLEPLPIFATDTTLEPGVFGIVRPVLLWPPGISDHLSEEQIEAILAHELCHLQRRDNLAAALHMVVQSAFWFHPLVWWIGARLVDERERACDEDVIRLGSPPEVYAESILKTCKFYVESPLVCVSGVTGSDLKKRIEHIMTNEPARSLSFWRQFALAVAGVATFATPVVLGALSPPPQTREVAAPATLPAFEEVSIRPNTTAGRGGRGGQMQPGRFNGMNLTLRTVIRRAFAPDGPDAPGNVADLFEQQVAGGPEWLDTEKFDIVATTPAATQPTRPPQMKQMLQRMLAERFRLNAHWERRELPVYALVRTQPGGPLPAALVRVTDEDCQKFKLPPGEMPAPGQLPSCGGIQFGPGALGAGGVPMAWVANTLVTVPVITGIDRMVLDRTGLEGRYRFALKFSPAGGSGPPDPARAELFTALQEQLGLKLEPIRAPIDVLVIDSVEKPEAN